MKPQLGFRILLVRMQNETPTKCHYPILLAPEHTCIPKLPVERNPTQIPKQIPVNFKSSSLLHKVTQLTHMPRASNHLLFT